MGNLEFKSFTRRHRPHITSVDCKLFLTLRLAGSIPQIILRSHRAKLQWLEAQLEQNCALPEGALQLPGWCKRLEQYHREWFVKTEEILHQAAHGPRWLGEAALARNVAENLHRLDGNAYRLDSFSIMSNHVHTVFKPFVSEAELLTLIRWDGLTPLTKYPGLAKIMHSVKGRTARECNLLLGRTGGFWEHESFDHVIRAGKFDKTVRYVLNNPVKAGLVDDWEDWPWNYCRAGIIERFRKKIECPTCFSLS